MFKNILTALFRSEAQTGDNASNPKFRTRYYKISRDKAWPMIVQAIKRIPKYKVLHEVEGVGEIIVQKVNATGRIQDITLTLFAINPIKTAIDIFSSSRSYLGFHLGDLGGNARAIQEIFLAIDKELRAYKLNDHK